MPSSIYFVTAIFSFSFQKNGGARAKIPLNSDLSICSEKAWYICCSSISNIPPILGTDLMFKPALIIAARHTSDITPNAWETAESGRSRCADKEVPIPREDREGVWERG